MGRKNLLIALAVAMGTAAYSLYRNRRSLTARALQLSPARYDVGVERNIRVPMHDGITLHTDHYYPNTRGAFPTILIRTPYGAGWEAGLFGALGVFHGQRFAERGYHVIIQNTRGRFDSEGEFDPFIHEANDGKATLDWIEQQAWFDGNLGTWGESYLGYVQWAIADDPRVKAMVPCITASQFYNITYPDDNFGLDTVLRWTAIIEAMDRRRERNTLDNMRRFSRQNELLEPAFAHLPLNETDRVLFGETLPLLQQRLSGDSENDQYWREVDHRSNVARTQASVHFIGGWYDLFLRDLLCDYATRRDSGSESYLTIGPWYHTDLRNMLDSMRLGIDWLDVHLKGDGDKLRTSPVHIYVMGADEWRETNRWPVPAQETRYYLHSNQRLSLEPPAGEMQPDRYIYDPADPTPALSGPTLAMDARPVDNRSLEARRDVLIYSTPVLTQDVEVIGAVRLELYVHSSLEYADFFGRLCDVHPDGRSINICDGLFRIKPGKGERQPDSSLRIEVDMWATANRFKRGHRIRLQVSSGAHPRWNRNLGTGEPIAHATRMCIAQQTIYHDATHPSALVLPVIHAQ